MHKAVLPILTVALGAAGGPVVADLIHTFNRQAAAEDMLTFDDCKNGNFPTTQRMDGTLQCAGIELEKIDDDTAPKSLVEVDWDATEKRIVDSYESAKKARPSKVKWALGGAGVVLVVQSGISRAQRRTERRLAKAA